MDKLVRLLGTRLSGALLSGTLLLAGSARAQTTVAAETDASQSASALVASSSPTKDDAEDSDSASDEGVPPVDDRTQFVLFCFDVTPLWGRTLEDSNIHRILTRARKARPDDWKGEDPTVTVFMNTGFLQVPKYWKPKRGTEARRRGLEFYGPYRADRRREGTKVLRYAKDLEFIEQSVTRLKAFQAMGVELASHGVMHLNGTTWTEREWRAEFNEHARVLTLLGLPPAAGYRAPFLATGQEGPASLSDPLFRVMRDAGMRYDSSKYYNRGPRWPRKVVGTEIWEVPIETTLIDGQRQMMYGDYGIDDETKHFDTSMKEFNKRYRGERAPIILGGHGEHMGSNLKLMKAICYLEDVRCGTFSELVAYMDAHPGLNAYRGAKRSSSSKRKAPSPARGGPR